MDARLQHLIGARHGRDNAPGRLRRGASQPPVRDGAQHFGLRRVGLHLYPAFDTVGRCNAAQLDQIRGRRAGMCGFRHVSCVAKLRTKKALA
ncbi:Uncharacterised protein [Bordetella pertussis]|nr:Uncharacterised protein [Bordetella pertussis]CFP66906.1 Uncharacterised protein [Bordetella pertussis]